MKGIYPKLSTIVLDDSLPNDLADAKKPGSSAQQRQDEENGDTRQSVGGLTMGSGFSGMLNHLTFGLFKNASTEKEERKSLDAAPGEDEETKI